MDIPLTAPIQLRPIAPGETEEAKRLILTVAQTIYAPAMTVEAFGEPFLRDPAFFADLDAADSRYTPPEGYFLVATDNGRLIGTGGIQRFDERTAELRRLWLLPAYHGLGIGYRLLQELMDVARNLGYERMVLQTGLVQERAIRFYRRVGFTPAMWAMAGADEDDLALEMEL